MEAFAYLYKNYIIKTMIQEQINRLVATLQALTLQRMNALRMGKASEAQQIQSVQTDIDSKIHELQRQLSSH
jgi:hypothetical protein|tara:strand:- start:774 stop:989 length:216 start_codon:yes stop_codon:yes gene_type:complete